MTHRFQFVEIKQFYLRLTAIPEAWGFYIARLYQLRVWTNNFRFSLFLNLIHTMDGRIFSFYIYWFLDYIFPKTFLVYKFPIDRVFFNAVFSLQIDFCFLDNFGTNISDFVFGTWKMFSWLSGNSSKKKDTDVSFLILAKDQICIFHFWFSID